MDRQATSNSTRLNRFIALVAAVLAACGGTGPQREAAASARACVVELPEGADAQQFVQDVQDFKIDACGSMHARAELAGIDLERVEDNEFAAHQRLVFLLRFLGKGNGPTYIP